MSYKVRHRKITMDDFYADRHRFSFTHRGKHYNAECYGAIDVIFEDKVNVLPDKVLTKVSAEIFRLIDKYENKWIYPRKAYEVASRYCEEEFA